MARIRQVYKSPEWEPARRHVITRAHGLCEECLRHGRIEAGKDVHHIIELTEENWQDWDIAFNRDNLELLCASCHNQKHGRCTGLAGFLAPARGVVNTTAQECEGIGMNVIIVWGAPASGKTTYVRERMLPGDLVIDLDLIKQSISMAGKTAATDSLLPVALSVRDHLYSLVAQRAVNCETAWIVSCLPRHEERCRLADKLRATDIVFIEAAEQECVDRALRDEERRDKGLQFKIIRNWFSEFRRGGGRSGLDQFTEPVG